MSSVSWFSHPITQYHWKAVTGSINSVLESGLWVYSTTNPGKLKLMATEQVETNILISDCKKFNLMLEYLKPGPVHRTREINLDEIRIKRANIDPLYRGISMLDTGS